MFDLPDGYYWAIPVSEDFSQLVLPGFGEYFADVGMYSVYYDDYYDE